MSGTNRSDLTGKSSNRRKLIAIVYADMVGYSRLIGLDDLGTIERLRTLRSTLIDPAISQHGGRIVQTGGDSLLIVFDSIDGAVHCALKVQQQISFHDGVRPPDRAIQFRIGINIGDVIADGTDVHGDAVNVAARLQAECPPGGICVTRAVRDHVRDRLEVNFGDLGALNLKNITRPVEAFVLRANAVATGRSSVQSAPAAFAAPAHSAPERRYITALAAELVAAEGASLPDDPEDLRALVDAYRRYAAAAVAKYGGTLAESRMRDVLAYFGYPVAQEEATERAIHTGLSLTAHLPVGDAALPAGLAVRVGVTSGLVVTDPDGEVLGETLAEARRLLHLSDPDQVIVAASSRRLAGGLFAYRDLEPLAVKGNINQVQAWHVLGPSALGSRSEMLFADALVPLVNREEEFSLLLRDWRRARSGEGRLVLLSGEPGIGKSRLLAALVEQLAAEPHASQRYFCSPLHQDSALHPVIARWEQEAGFVRADSAEQRWHKLEGIIASAELPAEDVALIAALLSLPTDERYPQLELSPQRRKERTFAALHHRLVSLTRTGPLLLLFEDAHWADPSSLELLDGLLDRLAEMPILLVVSYRPEFTPPWIRRAGATLVTLGRLTREHSVTLAELVATEHVLTRALLERIVIQTDGVPLFIEELTKAVLETSPGDTALSLPIPATLQASLMARLDRLPVGKRVAQIAAVIGQEFSHALLVATAGLPEAQLAQGLDELVASRLATRRGVAPEAIYTFKHALVHDAVYESVLKGQRAEIHSAVVAAAERDTLLAIEPGIVGHHCAQAGLVAKAVNYYCLAGKQAAERAAAIETRVQLERGLQFVATLPGSRDHHCLEADLLLALADVLQLTKGFANLETEGVLARAIPLCRRLDDPQLLVRALEAQFAFVATRGDMASAHAAAQELLDGAEASGEPLMNALARMVMGCVLFWQGRFTGARKQLEASVALTPRGPEVNCDSRADIYGRANLAPTLACLGYPEQAAEQVRQAIDWASRRGSFALAYGLSVAGRALVVLQDDVNLRERTLAQITLCEERGYLQQLAAARGALGWLEAKQGRVEQGLYLVRAGLAALHKLGAAFSLPFLLGLEADVLVLAGHWSEALAALARALEVSHRTGEAWFNAELHRRRGELLLTGTQPDSVAGEREFRQAIAIAREQSAKLFELRAGTSLARLWIGQKKRTEAVDLLRPIFSWFTEGFDIPDLKEAKAFLD